MSKDRIDCETENVEIENDRGIWVKSVSVKCCKCDHTEESYGRSDSSVRRCLALLRENCPNGESNYYDASEAEDIPEDFVVFDF